MAGELSNSNLRVAGFLIVFLCPMMGTHCVTQEIPATMRWASPVVCAEGSHVVTDTQWSSDRQGSYSRTDARCEDATGHEVGANVYPKILALYYVPLLLAWAAVLAWIFRKRPGDIDPPHA